MESNPDRVRMVYELAGETNSVSTHLADLTWRWRNELAYELIRRLAPGDSVEFIAALAAGTTMNIIEIVVQTWAENPGTNAKDLAREAMSLLRGDGIPLPTAAH